MIYEFEGRIPKISEKAYVHESAVVIGKVTLEDLVFIGPGAVLRGDYGTITIGEGTSIEDNCVIHARPGEFSNIGKNVTVGHGAIVHTATVHDHAVIGMGSVVSDYAVIGDWAVVGEGCVVKQKQEVPAKKIVVGIPAVVKGEVNEEYQKQWLEFKKIYQSFTYRYPKGLKRLL